LPQFSRTESKDSSTLTNIVDVDGDRRPDVVFAVSESKKIQAGTSDVTLRRYFVFVRRNLGSGNYAPPQFLFVTDKEEAMRGIPYEDVDRDVFKDPKRSEYLKGLISNVSY
jgi:hypothetical protein